ncbi:hypothetical protein ARMSODRAFT_978959 [Armillaria solidipes]|uniref:Uncharacterized protein n=1 Tax=Armillaria solidipes TaxID=1076256 RepID=A0A2H3B1C9_9AGAR|nr:hypothetical protein ARMSODRAFT_978959 [Armillaria solidipes]
MHCSSISIAARVIDAAQHYTDDFEHSRTRRIRSSEPREKSKPGLLRSPLRSLRSIPIESPPGPEYGVIGPKFITRKRQKRTAKGKLLGLMNHLVRPEVLELDASRPLGKSRYRHSGESSTHGLERAPKIRLASRGIKKDRTQKPDRIPPNSSTALVLRATREKIAGTEISPSIPVAQEEWRFVRVVPSPMDHAHGVAQGRREISRPRCNMKSGDWGATPTEPYTRNIAPAGLFPSAPGRKWPRLVVYWYNKA